MGDTQKQSLRYISATLALAAAAVYVIGTIVSAAIMNGQKKWIPILKSQMEQHAQSADTSNAALVKATSFVMNGEIPISVEACSSLRTATGRDLDAADAYMGIIMDTKKQVDTLFAAKDTTANWNVWRNVEKIMGNEVRLQKLAIARGSTMLDAQAVDDIKKISQWRIQQALAAERAREQSLQAPAGNQRKARSHLR